MIVTGLSNNFYLIHNEIIVTITPSNPNAFWCEVTATSGLETQTVKLYPINNIFEFDVSVLAKLFFTYESLIDYDNPEDNNNNLKLIEIEFKIIYSISEEIQNIIKYCINGYNQINDINYFNENFFYEKYKLFAGFPFSIITDRYTIISTNEVSQLIPELTNINYTIIGDCYPDNVCYIKWLNSKGYYSYWLFKGKKEYEKVKEKGKVQRYFQFMNEVTSNVNSLGFSSEIEIICYDVIEKEYWLQVKELYSSREVYLWNKKQYEVSLSLIDWIKVIPSSNPPKLDYRYNTVDFEFQFNLPERYTNSI